MLTLGTVTPPTLFSNTHADLMALYVTFASLVKEEQGNEEPGNFGNSFNP